MKGVGKIYCIGSAWTDVALEAKLITTGSMSEVTEWKNLDMATNTHTSMLEALKRLLYDKYIESMNHPLLKALPLSPPSLN